MTEIIELRNCVFESVVTPDTPGDIPRTLTIRQLSGEPLGDEQWERLRAEVVAHMGRCGAVVRRAEIREKTGGDQESR